MSNILGDYLLKASNDFKSNKGDGESYEDYFIKYYMSCVKDDEMAAKILNEFLNKKIISVKETPTNKELESLFYELKCDLIKHNAISESCNVGELLGYIFLGNVYSYR